MWTGKDGQPIADRFPRNQADQAAALIDFTKPVTGGPIDHGFDIYFGDDVPNFPPYTFFENDRLTALPTEMKPDTMFGDPGPMAPGWDLQAVQPTIAERAIEYIRSREQRGEPFFLYLPLNIPHTPLVPDDASIGKSEAGVYGDVVHQADAIVGRVMRALEDAGLADSTIVIFTSDNGSPAGDGHATVNGRVVGNTPHTVTKRFGHVPNAPWRGLKSDIWEAGHRVPMIVRWPGVVQAGSTSNQLVCLVDWYATFADLHGVELHDGQAEDSFSMLHVLRGDNRIIRPTLIHHSGNGTFAIRVGDWKLIRGNLGSGGFSQPGMVKPGPDGPQGQLYNLAEDPGETTNRWQDEPGRVEAMLLELETLVKQGYSRE